MSAKCLSTIYGFEVGPDEPERTGCPAEPSEMTQAHSKPPTVGVKAFALVTASTSASYK